MDAHGSSQACCDVRQPCSWRSPTAGSMYLTGSDVRLTWAKVFWRWFSKEVFLYIQTGWDQKSYRQLKPSFHVNDTQVTGFIKMHRFFCIKVVSLWLWKWGRHAKQKQKGSFLYSMHHGTVCSVIVWVSWVMHLNIIVSQLRNCCCNHNNPP